MGCVQQNQTKRQHLESADTTYQENKSHGIASRPIIQQERKKEIFKIQLNPIVQRRLSPQRRKQSDL
ncbi:unnamed protein product [Paramecium primaurelia]|uniref:Uncharacterized protein n=2 Tax=Paramecium TaxID=5884 RepID=A0A8S1VV15_9CILI|nr:unnamed protein product [Paramecium primaurelia]CAD8180025.1 unnamed protein product [Paramecium pentaurelia]